MNLENLRHVRMLQTLNGARPATSANAGVPLGQVGTIGVQVRAVGTPGSVIIVPNCT